MDSVPKSQNRRHWALVNPREILECKYLGKKKAISWVGVLKGTLLSPFWFVDARDNPVTLNQETYLDMLKSKHWPILLTLRDLRRLWFMQEGATCHYTVRVLTWLHSKFEVYKQEECDSLATPKPGLESIGFFGYGVIWVK